MAKNDHVVGSFQLMKSINKSLILNIIRTEGEISRAEIAKMTKLTPPTVTNLVGELLTEGIVLEGQAGPSSGGRRPIMLSVNHSRYYVVGVDVGIDSVRYVLTDLFANIVMKKEKSLPPNTDGETLIEVLSENITNLLNDSEIDKDKILGIGIGMPGIVNYETGTCIDADLLNIYNLPLKERMEAVLHIPVVVENDVRATALGEKWFGNGKDVSDMICINIGHETGAGIILNNEIFRGENGIAGAIGHTMVEMDGHRCSCGRIGCLQSVVSHEGIKYFVNEKLEAGRETIIREMIGDDIEKVNGKVVYEAAKKGDDVATEVIQKMGSYLGITIANLIDIINPQRIILAGGLSQLNERILQPVHEVLNERALSEDSKNTQIVLAHLKDNATVVGSATLILNEFFLGELAGK